MADAAEQLTNNFLAQEEDIQNRSPLVMVVPALPQEAFYRRQAERLIYAGRIATKQCLGPEQTERSPISSLMEAIQLAAKGNEKGLEQVKVNVWSDVPERTIKAGLLMEVKLEVDEQNEILQNGQYMDSIQSNTLLFASNNWQMRGRTEAEARNRFRIGGSLRQGLLNEYNFVVFSRIADNMTNQELDDVGFFTDTMSCSIQVTKIDDDGVLKLESAFVAGVREVGGAPHDQETIAKVGEGLGVNYHDKTSTEIIDTPLLIHKSLMPNGVIDLVKLYDDCAGDTFFGENKPKQDYLKYQQQCQERVEGYAPRVQEITGQLIARADEIKTPIDAVRLLDKLSDRAMAKLATYDKSINPRVFGNAAAIHIEQARIHLEQGNSELAVQSTKNAQAVSVSRSCPSGLLGDRSSKSSEVSDSSEPNKETWHGGKKYYNSKCHSCKRIRAEVGACHICRDCVHKPAKMQRAYDKDRSEAKDRSKSKTMAQVISMSRQAIETEKVPEKVAA